MKVLVIVDMQNDFIDGSLGTPEAKAIVPNVVEKIRGVDMDTLVLLTKDVHGEDYLETLEGKMNPIKHCIDGTPGCSIHKDISHASDYDVRGMRYSGPGLIKSRIIKHTYGSDILRDILYRHKDRIEEVEFVGLYTENSVVSNALMARQTLPNTRIKVDAVCCAGGDVFNHEAALGVMEMCGIEITNWGI